MKFNLIIAVIIILIAYNDYGLAQRGHDYEIQKRPRPERLEKFRKMRLVELLKLDEEESVRFFAKQNAHENKTRELMQKRNDLIDMIEKNIKEKGNTNELMKLADEAMKIDKDIFAERQRFQEEIRKLLTPEQFGKFIVFERDFGKQVREAMQEMRRGIPNTPPEE